MALDLPPNVPLFDADGALSREFLLHRGFCCENGCRNCPYGFRAAERIGAPPPGEAPRGVALRPGGPGEEG